VTYPIADLEAFIDRHPRLLVLTGAGCSTDSGIPDYRDTDGAWKRKPPVTFQAFTGNDTTRRRYWARSLVGWRYFGMAEPNATHRALARLEEHGKVSRLVTQNVDGLHARAGSTEPIELHGSLWRVRCTGCEAERAIDEPIEGLPTCGECGALERPGVVWFGESLPEEPFELAIQAVMRAQVVLVVGTSGVVQPAASLVEMGRARGATVIEVNPEASAGGRNRIALLGRAGEVLPELVRRANQT